MAISPKRQLAGVEELSANEQFFDALLRHQIGLFRVVGSMRNEIFTLLDETETDIRRQISDVTRLGVGLASPRQVQRLERLLKQITEVRNAAWDKVNGVWLDRIPKIGVAEAAHVDGLLRTAMPVSLETNLPNTRRLRDITFSRPFRGRTLREWAQNIRRVDIERIESQVKIGLVQGESGPQIARRVVGTVRARGTDGVTEITRKQASAITRTVVNGVANQSRRMYFVENESLIDSELFVATLDSRTTLVCSGLDGKRFPVGEGPIPPIHFACRSLRTALVDPEPLGLRPMKPTTERMLLREFTSQEDIAVVTKRANLPFGTKGRFDEFRRRRVRELIGRVPAKTSFQTFLSRQSVEFQNDYLGVPKARLFRAGLPLDKFVDPVGRPLNLNELARREASAFQAAGLDPENFL